ncbi:MAG: 2'-5' RNA ligase family protein [Desulfobacterales bacterium]
MAGRFGKYGDLKRREVLQRGRKGEARLAKSSSRRWEHHRGIVPSAHTSWHPAAPKTHKTAVVIIPPADLWAPIQALRQQYDRHFRRWMPHITLLYPFRPLTELKRVTPILAQACVKKAPFEVRLQRFAFFTHARRSATFYLVPEPATAIKALHQALLDKVPDCSDVAQFAGGFTPHLSLGQTRSREIEVFCRRWRATWRPITFTLEQVHLIWRNDPPDDIFRMGPALPLGSPSTPP